MSEKRLKRNNSVEEMELDFADDSEKENYFLKNTNENIEDRVSHISVDIPQLKDLTNVMNSLESNPSIPLASSETQADPESSDDFIFEENELFNFLKASLKGQIILGKYRKTKSVDYAMLKELVIYDKINENPFNFKIKPKTFIDLRNQIVALFPTEDPDFLYISASGGKENEYVGAKGCLYNYYKIVRKELRKAGMLSESENLNELSHEKSIESVNSFSCITNLNQESYSIVEITKQWEETFGERMKLLSQKEKKIKTPRLETYLRSFPCLSSPIGILLLEQDFTKIVFDLANKDSISNEEAADYSSLFRLKWPTLAKKIILQCKKSRSLEIKEFFELHEQLIDAGTHDSLLALFLLPLGIKSVKKVQIEDRSVTLTKADISKCFILHIEESQNLQEEQKKFESWLKDLKQEVLPYLILIGKLESPLMYIRINSENFIFQDTLKAVESCYKCLTALKAIPFICDFVWSFIEKAVYNFTPKKSNSWVSKFIVDMNKK